MFFYKIHKSRFYSYSCLEKLKLTPILIFTLDNLDIYLSYDLGESFIKIRATFQRSTIDHQVSPLTIHLGKQKVY